MILKDIWLDVKAVKERDPAARSALEVLLLYQGVPRVDLAQNRHWFYQKSDVFYCPPDFPDCQIFYSD